jgi:histone H2B
MAPKPASTAGKAPTSTAAKIPSKTVEKKKAAKKTAKPPDTSDKTMAILNSFVNDIFKCINGEAPSKSKNLPFSHRTY